MSLVLRLRNRGWKCEPHHVYVNHKLHKESKLTGYKGDLLLSQDLKANAQQI